MNKVIRSGVKTGDRRAGPGTMTCSRGGAARQSAREDMPAMGAASQQPLKQTRPKDMGSTSCLNRLQKTLIYV